jgi:hypothetical protein
MAIQTNTYNRVDMLVADVANGYRVLVCAYTSKWDRDAGSPYISCEQFNFPYAATLVGANPVAQAYSLLKTLPQFAEGVEA